MSRRPARRRYPARRRRHRGQAPLGLPVDLIVVAVVVAAAMIALVQWLIAHWLLLLAVGGLVAADGGMWLYARRQRALWEAARARGLRFQLQQIDALHHSSFELAVRDLMRRDGCIAERLGGAGDDACDVKATDAVGRVWAVQCKHKRRGLAGSAVGTPVLQQVNGTARPVHGADVAVVVTNGRFTAKAVEWGRRHGVHLVDRQLLATWAGSPRPLWELLRRLPPPPGYGLSEDTDAARRDHTAWLKNRASSWAEVAAASVWWTVVMPRA